jgi:rod shape-determining protein MreD
MAFVIYALVILLAAMVESTLGYRLDVIGARVNLVLVLVVAWAFERGVQAGLLAGLVGGLALDLVSGTPFGLQTLLLGLIGGVAALGEGTLARGGLGLLFGTAILATVAYHGIMVLALRVFGWDWPGAMRMVNILVPTIFLNCALMPFAVAFARRIERSFSGWRRMELE